MFEKFFWYTYSSHQLCPVTQLITLSITILGIVMRAMEGSTLRDSIYAYFFMNVYKVLNISYFTASVEEALRSELSYSPFALCSLSLYHSTCFFCPFCFFLHPSICLSFYNPFILSNSVCHVIFLFHLPHPWLTKLQRTWTLVIWTHLLNPVHGAGVHCYSLLLHLVSLVFTLAALLPWI